MPEWLQIALGTAAVGLASLGGAGVIIMGFSRWLGRVWAEKILEADRAKYQREIEQQKAEYQRELERLRSGLEEAVYVTRAQFEVEFDALQSVWSALSKTRTAMEPIRPASGVERLGETWTEKLEARLPPFQDAYNELFTMTRELQPWFPAEIHAALRSAIGIAHTELMQLLVEHPDKPGNQQAPAVIRWFESGRVNNEKLGEACERVEQLMRDRLASLRIQPN